MRRSFFFLALSMTVLAIGGRVNGQSPHHGVARASGEVVVASHVVSDQIISTSEGSSCPSGKCGRGGKPQSVDPTTVGGSSGAYGTGSGMVGRRHNPPDLFANYYTQGEANQINAQMYIAPLPVPPWVGHTWNTYQPLAPHQFLYSHQDRYHHHYDEGRGLNRTSITYRPAAPQVLRDMYYNFRIPR